MATNVINSIITYPGDGSQYSISCELDPDTGVITFSGFNLATGKQITATGSSGYEYSVAITKVNQLIALYNTPKYDNNPAKDKQITLATQIIAFIDQSVSLLQSQVPSEANGADSSLPTVIAPAATTATTQATAVAAGIPSAATAAIQSTGSLSGGAAAIAGAGTSITSTISGVAGKISGSIGGALAGVVGAKTNSGTKKNAALAQVGSSIILPASTTIIPNPMHQFASWTYAISLWWLDVTDLNTMTGNADVGFGVNYTLSNKSYVIAEDSGLYPTRRLPTQNGLNYNIQDMEFESVVGLNSKSKSSNMTTGTMTIIEPLGMTFLDSLVKFSRQPDGTYRPHTAQPYMIQIDFVGYDDNGNLAPLDQLNIYRKRFPIIIRGMKIESTKGGSEYRLDYTTTNAEPSGSYEYSTTPKDITVIAGTVADFFDASKNSSFVGQLNQYWLNEKINQKTVQFADSIVILLDQKIASSNIVYTNMSIGQSDPNSSVIDLTKSSFVIPKGTQITEVINKVMIQSDYISSQLNKITLNTPEITNDDIIKEQTKLLNVFKIVKGVKYSGATSSGVTKDAAFDSIRNTYAKVWQYSVIQNTVYNASNPAAPQASDSTPYTVKSYNYSYTGKNIDVLDLKLNFDSTFFNVVNTYTNEVAASQTTSQTAKINAATNSANPPLTLPQLGALGLFKSALGMPNLTPQRYKPIIGDQRDNIGMNIIANPQAQKTSSVMRSIYSNDIGSSMQSITGMQIVGDPTLIKQDDILYTPTPGITTNYNNKIPQSSFAQKYGHIRMDDGDLIASVTVNTVTDYDLDTTNAGLMSPAIGTGVSLFSGQYVIKTIKNMFNQGMFTQAISMVRLTNDLIAQNANTVSTNSRPSVITNNGVTSVIGDIAIPTNLRPTLINDPRRLDQ